MGCGCTSGCHWFYTRTIGDTSCRSASGAWHVAEDDLLVQFHNTQPFLQHKAKVLFYSPRLSISQSPCYHKTWPFASFREFFHLLAFQNLVFLAIVQLTFLHLLKVLTPRRSDSAALSPYKSVYWAHCDTRCSCHTSTHCLAWCLHLACPLHQALHNKQKQEEQQPKNISNKAPFSALFDMKIAACENIKRKRTVTPNKNISIS